MHYIRIKDILVVPSEITRVAPITTNVGLPGSICKEHKLEITYKNGQTHGIVFECEEDRLATIDLIAKTLKKCR